MVFLKGIGLFLLMLFVSFVVLPVALMQSSQFNTVAKQEPSKGRVGMGQ